MAAEPDSSPLAVPRQNFDIFFHAPELLDELRSHRQLFCNIWATLQSIEGKIDTMSGTTNQLDANIQQLQTDVQADTDAVNSAVTLIGGIQKAISDAVAAALAAGATAAELQGLSDLSTSLQANNANLAAAVAANTPAAPPPAGVQAHVRPGP